MLNTPELGDRLTQTASTYVGGMITGLYAVIQWIDEDGEQRLAVASAPGQTMVTTQGMLTIANAVADTELTTYVMDSMNVEDDE